MTPGPQLRKVALVLLGAVFAAPRPTLAQSGASGRVAIQEKPGETTYDIGNTVVYLTAADGRVLRAPPVKVPIAMNGKEFRPHIRIVTPGSSVEYPNQDPFSHNIFSTAPGAAFDLGTYPNGVARAATFKKTGAFPIYCNIHSRMTAYVVVVPTPYFTQAGADGRWTLDHIPAGKYELHVWHERAPEIVTPLDVPAAGVSNVMTTLDARGFVATEHKNKFGKEYTSTGKDRY